MNIFRTSLFRSLALSLALPATALVLVGCDVGSTDSTTAVISDNTGTTYNYSGMYMSVSNASGSTNGYAELVFPPGRQSGVALTWLRLLQYGSALEGYDNAGLTWSGSLTVQNGEVANFNLQGKTTAGQSVDVIGTLAFANQQSTMDATWIEPAFSGSIFAQATVSPAVTSSPPREIAIDPEDVDLSTNDFTQTFEVSGGTSPYTWSVSSSSLGSVNPTTGDSTTYTSTHASGANTITVTDSAGLSATATATYTATNAGPTSLSVSPSALALNASVFKGTLKASGGTGTYEWMVSNTNLGSLSASTGSSVTYTSTKSNGVNFITVIDDNNASASATATYSN